MTLPFCCDATLPTSERYASLKYRRVARKFDTSRLDYDLATELVAFLQLVPVHVSRWIFQWDQITRKRAVELTQHAPLRADALPLHNQNLLHQGPDDGLALLRAMQDGGWKNGQVPPIIGNAIRHLNDHGLGRYRIAKFLDLKPNQVRRMMEGPRTAKPVINTGLLIG
jgi:hypothetical protein